MIAETLTLAAGIYLGGMAIAATLAAQERWSDRRKTAKREREKQ